MNKPGSMTRGNSLRLGTEGGQSHVNVRVSASVAWTCRAANCTCARKTGGRNAS